MDTHAAQPRTELQTPSTTPIEDVNFSDTCLTTSEARLLLEQRTKAFKKEDLTGTMHEQPALQREAAQYCETFARYRTPEATKAIRSALESAGLRPGEIAVMGSLCPSDVEEAKALIPSLSRFTYGEVKKMLMDIEQYKQY